HRVDGDQGRLKHGLSAEGDTEKIPQGGFNTGTAFPIPISANYYPLMRVDFRPRRNRRPDMPDFAAAVRVEYGDSLPGIDADVVVISAAAVKTRGSFGLVAVQLGQI